MKSKLRYKDHPLDVIGVAYDDTLEQVSEFIQKNNIDWTQVFQDKKNSKDADLIQKLKIESFPTVVLVDPNGKIIMRDNSIEKIEAKLKEIFH